MQQFPHCEINYENELRSADQHQSTIDKICSYPGVETNLVKATLSKGNKVTVTNLDQLRAMLQSNGFGGIFD